MGLTTLVIVLFYLVSCTFSFDKEMRDIKDYVERVQQTANLDFGHGSILKKPNLTDEFDKITIGDLRVILVDLYTTLECSYILNLYVHSIIFKSYLLLETKPNLTADKIEMYSFVKETHRMLTATHNVEKFSTAKYIMWAYLVYTEKMANIMRHPELNSIVQNSTFEREAITVIHQSIVNLLTRFICGPSCKNLNYNKKKVLNDWPVTEHDSITFEIWTKKLTNARNTVLRQLDFNDSKGVSSTDDNAYSMDVLRLKGVIDRPDKLNCLIRMLLANSKRNTGKCKPRGLLILPENVDCNSLEISSDSFEKLRVTIQTDFFPSLVEQIKYLIIFHSNFIQLLKAIPLQLINKYLLTVMNSMSGDSCMENRIAPIRNFNEEIANQLLVLVEGLHLGHDENMSGMVRFFNEISNSGRLSLSVVNDAQNALNTNLEKIGNLLFDGPIINTITFDVDSNSADSIEETENGTPEKLRDLVYNIKETVKYINDNITTFVNFKGIHSFIDIEFSEEFSTLQEDELNLKPQWN